MKTKATKKRMLALVALMMTACMLLLAFPVTVGATTDTDYGWDGLTYSLEWLNSGDGSANDPYEITNAAELAGLSYYVGGGIPAGQSNDDDDETNNLHNCNNQYFVITNDIDLGGQEWISIGGGSMGFGGIISGKKLDGSNITISNFVVPAATTAKTATLTYTDGSTKTLNYTSISPGQHGGLFSQTYDSARISNINVTNATLSAANGNGGIVGMGGGAAIIENCNVSNVTFGNASATSTGNGGIFGRGRFAEIRNCTVDVTIDSAIQTFGGIIANTHTAHGNYIIEGCKVTINTTGTPEISKNTTWGGIVPVVSKNLTIKNCEVTFNAAVGVSAGAVVMGGMVGTVDNGTTLTVTSDNNLRNKIDLDLDISNTGTVNPNFGGVVGKINSGAIVNISGCDINTANYTLNTTNTGGANFGGVVGIVYGEVIDYVEASGDTDATWDYRVAKTYVSDCNVRSLTVDTVSYTGTATPNVGGVIGMGIYSDKKDGDEVLVNGVTCPIVTEIDNCSVTGTVNIPRIVRFGGILTQITGNTKITNCYTNLSLNTESNITYAGGIAGYAANAVTIDNCVAEGDITVAAGTDDSFGIAGIVGDSVLGTGNSGTVRTITNSMYTGDITVTTTGSSQNMYLGGIAGKLMNSVKIDNCAMYGTVTANYSDTATHRSGIFAGGFGYGNAAGVTDATAKVSAITNSVCKVPTNTPESNDANDTGATLAAVGGWNGNQTTENVLGGLTLFTPATAEFAEMEVKGIQLSDTYEHELSDGSKVDVMDIRFTANLGVAGDTVDGTEVLAKYSNVGFVITSVYGTSVQDHSATLNYVYSSINATTGDGAIEAIAANDARIGGDYIVGIEGRLIPATGTITFYVTPHLTTVEGVDVYGETVTIVFTDGVLVSPVADTPAA